jgi:hypothetical protein
LLYISYVDKVTCYGFNFVTKKGGDTAKSVAEAFLKDELKITDSTFFETCLSFVVSITDQAYKNYNNTKTNLYRKMLKKCKLSCSTSRLLLILVIKLTNKQSQKCGCLDIQDKERDGVEIELPKKEDIMNCLSKEPQDCNEEEKEGMRIFYNVAVASVEKNIKMRLLATPESDMWEILDAEPGRWESSMAYAIVLIELDVVYQGMFLEPIPCEKLLSWTLIKSGT